MKTRDGELRLMANPRRVNASGQAVEPYAGPLAILVDGLTGSASECFTGGMQSLGRARVFGTQTMGQALPALFDRLPNGDILVHAFGDFVTATGDRLEGRGVIPDVEVAISRETLANGRDAMLEKALEWVDGVHLRPRQGL
jgi:carboxyl-terminal processing protease